MARKQEVGTNYNARVAARMALARELAKPKHKTQRAEAGLLDEDLTFIAAKGDEAAAHDRSQREQLATQKQTMKERLDARKAFDDQTEALRNRVPAVVYDLAHDAATRALAGWLAAAVFERFRVRVTPPAGTTAPGETAPAAPGRDVVLRHDRLAVAQSTVQFVQALLQPDRTAIVGALERRGMGLDRLRGLADTAAALVETLGGKEALKAAEATRLEAEAVAAQKERWDACRRMIRQASAADPDLSALWAAC